MDLVRVKPTGSRMEVVVTSGNRDSCQVKEIKQTCVVSGTGQGVRALEAKGLTETMNEESLHCGVSESRSEPREGSKPVER